MPSILPMTRTLLLINVVVFLIGPLLGPWFDRLFALWPIGHGFLPWQLLTYAFMHGSFEHIFFNMFGLWMFGSEVERVWGEKRYLHFYIACVLAAAFTQLIFNAVTGSPYPTIGASGGLFGLLLAFGMMFPNRIILLFFVLPVKAKYLVIGYGLLELYQGVYVMNSGVAHFAHLGGMLGGLLMIRYWRGQPPFGRRRR